MRAFIKTQKDEVKIEPFVLLDDEDDDSNKGLSDTKADIAYVTAKEEEEEDWEYVDKTVDPSNDNLAAVRDFSNGSPKKDQTCEKSEQINKEIRRGSRVRNKPDRLEYTHF